MKYPRKSLTALALLASAWPLVAQSVPPAPAPTADKDEKSIPVVNRVEEEALVLSPFEVTSTQDRGYQATETLAGTRIRTDLKDVGSAISVITKEFMQDIGATDTATLLQYTTNAEVAGTRGTYAGLGNGTSVDETGTLRAPAGANRVRGLAAADNTRDFFVTDIPWDNYNVDRIDIQRGPNSILFGLGSPAGIVNASTRNAEFRTTGRAEARFGSYGSARGTLDFNQVLIPKVLAVRVDGLWSKEKFQQDPAFQDDKRVYGALRFDPQLFNRSDFRTSIRAKYENGDIKANRPRILPPADSITPWFRPVNTASLNGGVGKLAINSGYDVGSNAAATNPWLSASIANQQQPLWFMDGTTNQLYRIYGGYVNTGARNLDGSLRGIGDALVGQRYSDQFFGLTNLATYATNARLPNAQYGQFRQSSLLDSSVFNYYDQLIDGPNKSEFEKWDTYSIELSQTAWGDRVGVQLNYDRQKYKRGGQALLGNPTLTIDVLRNFQDLTANPNFGRPYVVGGPGSGNSYQSDREYTRASIFGEIRSADFFKRDSFLTKLLGKHRLNGVVSDEDYETENRSWRMYAHSREWAGYWNRNDGSNSDFRDRAPVGVIYLGSSLANAASASGAYIPNISSAMGLANGSVYHFASTWTNPAGVAFNNPYSVPTNLTSMLDAATATTQVSNPANYIGWNTNFQDNLLRYNDGADLSLLTNAQKSLRVTKSYAGTWQGFLWDGAVVPTLGWRYDKVKGKGVGATPVTSNRQILNIQPDVYRLPDAFPANQTFEDHSTAGGVVAHLNKLLGSRDRLPLNVSVSYNKSNNFQVTDTRRDFFGNPI
ncbi:MAG: TonB-dependent receptor, partial [Opitutaceae bacterium]|nr:TonB-dependent receptor [Opitutaceae bacterium]